MSDISHQHQPKPYSEYKDSGQPWLGNVPAHWAMTRAKLLYREVDERSTTGMETLCSVSHKTGVTPRKANVTMFMSESTVGYKICRPDDLAINTLWAWMAALGIARQVGVVSPAYGVYRPRPNSPLNPQYADRLLRTEQYKQEYIARSTGVNASRLRLYPDQFLQIPILVPPSGEQSAIVRFLAAVDRRVNRLVRAKRRLIELLTEQKQAIITHAVTRGLNPNAKLKPSGIDWLGDVPEHWEVLSLARLISFGPKNGVSPPAAAHDAIGATSFSIAAIREGLVQIGGNEKQVTLAPALVSRFQIAGGDVLLVRGNGNLDFVARCGLVEKCDDEVIYPDIIIKVRPNEKMNAGFMVRAINSPYVRNQVARLAKTTNGAHKISGASISALKLAVPPIAEQVRIQEDVFTAVRTSDEARIAAQREIELLREYRTRLVADVVTGKLDVREAAAKLPQEETEAAGVIGGESDEPQDDTMEESTAAAAELGEEILEETI